MPIVGEKPAKAAAKAGVLFTGRVMEPNALSAFVERCVWELFSQIFGLGEALPD